MASPTTRWLKNSSSQSPQINKLSPLLSWSPTSSRFPLTLANMEAFNLQIQGLTPNLYSPANEIINPLNPSQGYGRLRHFNRMKREQFLRNAHPPLSVRWDEQDLSTIVDVLESCGNNGYRMQQKQMFSSQQTQIPLPNMQVPMNSRGNFGYQQQPERRFDPRAPHFDVILIDLTNAINNAAPLHAATDGPDTANLSVPTSNCNQEEQGSRSEHQDSASGNSENTPGPLHRNGKVSSVRNDMHMLPMESLAGRPGWVFLWVGSTDGLVEGRRILGSWGFRKVECIGWMKTDVGWDVVKDVKDPVSPAKADSSAGILHNAVEWCLMGCKGSAKRTYDSHLIHCNVSTDVMISDSQEPPICTLLSNLIENFSLGQRRLHLFAKPGDERPGWITVGRDFESTNFDCKRYLRTWGESGRQGWLTTFDPEIEYFRPKTPPLQVRRRERAFKFRRNNRTGGDNSIRGRGEIELPRFPHTGQRKRLTWRVMTLSMQKAYTAYAHVEQPAVTFSFDEGKTTFQLPSNQTVKKPAPPENAKDQKPLTDLRVSELPGYVRQVWPQQHHMRAEAPPFSPPELAKQSEPSHSVRDTPQDQSVRPLAHHPHYNSHHQSRPGPPQLQKWNTFPIVSSDQQRMGPQSHQAKAPVQPPPLTRSASQGMPVSQPYLAMPSSQTDTSASSGGQSGQMNSNNTSYQPESPTYKYTRPVYTSPENLSTPYIDASGTDSATTSRTVTPTSIRENHTSSNQALKNQFSSAQMSIGDTDIKGGNRQFPQMSPGFGKQSATFSPSSGQPGNTPNNATLSQPKPLPRLHEGLGSHRFNQYRNPNPGLRIMIDGANQPFILPQPSVSHSVHQQQFGLPGGYSAVGSGPAFMSGGPQSYPRFPGPTPSHYPNSNFRYNHGQYPSMHSGNYGGFYRGGYEAPHHQDYVRGENGEFIVNHPQYTPQPYIAPTESGKFRVEQRQQVNFKNNQHQAQHQAQMMGSQGQAGMPSGYQQYY